jgi:hypothetical protein
MCLEGLESMMKEEDSKVLAINAWHLSLSSETPSFFFELSGRGMLFF